MVYKEFKDIYNRFCNYFGKFEYMSDETMIKIYFKEMKYINFNLEEFEQMVYEKCTYFPKVAEIHSIRKNELKNVKATVNINTKVCDCNKCNGTGYRLMIEVKNDIPYEFIVACDCRNGDNKIYDGRTISDKKHRSCYIIPRFSEKFVEISV